MTELKDLYRVKDKEKLVGLFVNAFGDYPKLDGIFTPSEKGQKRIALEASLRFYLAFDLKYGQAYSTDANVKDAIVFLNSEDVNYSCLRLITAGCYSGDYRTTLKKLTHEQRQKRRDLFTELDQLEKTLDLPKKHIYIDFLGVEPGMQSQGRGRALLAGAFGYARQENRPIMLFTNTKEDVRYYQKVGFKIAGIVKSEKYKYESTYFVWDGK